MQFNNCFVRDVLGSCIVGREITKPRMLKYSHSHTSGKRGLVEKDFTASLQTQFRDNIRPEPDTQYRRNLIAGHCIGYCLTVRRIASALSNIRYNEIALIVRFDIWSVVTLPTNRWIAA